MPGPGHDSAGLGRSQAAAGVPTRGFHRQAQVHNRAGPERACRVRPGRGITSANGAARPCVTASRSRTPVCHRVTEQDGLGAAQQRRLEWRPARSRWGHWSGFSRFVNSLRNMIEFRLLNRCHAEEVRADAPRPGAGFGAPPGPPPLSLTSLRLPPQVLAQHGHLHHRHRGERRPPAPAPRPAPRLPVAAGPAQARPGAAAVPGPRGEGAEAPGPRAGEDAGGGRAGGQQRLPSEVGVRGHTAGSTRVLQAPAAASDGLAPTGPQGCRCV